LWSTINSNFKYEALCKFLDRLLGAHASDISQKHERKLYKLYGGQIMVKEQKNNGINLSTCVIDSDILEIFNLGMNCHLKTKFDINKTKIEIEKLNYSVKNYVQNDKLQYIDEDRFKTELKRFGLKNRHDYTRDLLSKEQHNKIKQFIKNPDIIIRKADKSNTFVILNKKDYEVKISEFLRNDDKFLKIKKDPTNSIKTDINNIFTIINRQSDCKLAKLYGHFEPGYLYGNPKIHKSLSDPPLRPIISQVGTVTYNTAKMINRIITPYMNRSYMVESTFDFIEITKAMKQPKLMASLDVENLFTNVPVAETINIILEAVYNHQSKIPPAIPKEMLRKLLIICTTMTPFRAPNGDLYQQINGVSMGTPLGPTMANFYMSYIENKIFEEKPHLKTPVYCRYIDDILLTIDSLAQLEQLKTAFEEESVLKFTYEVENSRKISFLDVLITRNTNSVSTSVYTKSTNSGDCLNYNSNCPERYKTSVIKNFIHRAYSICSDWNLFHEELARIKQLLCNNNFPNCIIDTEIRRFLDKKMKKIEEQPNERKEKIPLYFQNQMTKNYKQEESNLRKILKENVYKRRINIARFCIYCECSHDPQRHNEVMRTNCRTALVTHLPHCVRDAFAARHRKCVT